MESLVHELQKSCWNEEDLGKTLLKAKALAHKLDAKEVLEWIELEISGYPTGVSDWNKIPGYRWMRGMLQGMDEYGRWCPVASFSQENADYLNRISALPVGDSVSQLEDLAKNNTESSIVHFYYTESLKHQLMGDACIKLRLIVGNSHIIGVLSNVRNKILDWALALEKNKILGEGMSFSSEDRAKAAQVQNISFNGCIGVALQNQSTGDLIQNNQIIQAPEFKDFVEGVEKLLATSNKSSELIAIQEKLNQIKDCLAKGDCTSVVLRPKLSFIKDTLTSILINAASSEIVQQATALIPMATHLIAKMVS